MNNSPSMPNPARSASEEYKSRFSALLLRIEESLEQVLTVQAPEVLWRAMRHGVLGAGKRIRPVLMLEISKAAGVTDDTGLKTACALEMIHCYSLIHDDLPCMDDDDLRRGRPTVHKAFSEDIAVLSGDALLAMAFGQITRESGLSSDQKVRLVAELSSAAGVEGLVNGQVDDLQFEKYSGPADQMEAVLYRIHQGKTGALFRFACRSGGIIAKLPDTAIDTLGQFGLELGVAFQIVDDLLDVQSSDATLGKTTGKDQAKGKLTFPRVFGVEGSVMRLEETISRLNRYCQTLSAVMDTTTLSWLVQFVKERTY